MGVHSELTAGAHPFEHGGRTYNVRLIDQEVKERYEKAKFQRAKDAVALLRDVMDRDHYNARLDAVGDDYLQGKFSLDNVAGLNSLKTVDGGLLLVCLLFGVDNHEAMNLLIERGDDVTALLKVILRESFPAVKDAQEGGGEDAQKKAPSPTP